MPWAQPPTSVAGASRYWFFVQALPVFQPGLLAVGWAPKDGSSGGRPVPVNCAAMQQARKATPCGAGWSHPHDAWLPAANVRKLTASEWDIIEYHRCPPTLRSIRWGNRLPRLPSGIVTPSACSELLREGAFFGDPRRSGARSATVVLGVQTIHLWDRCFRRVRPRPGDPCRGTAPSKLEAVSRRLTKRGPQIAKSKGARRCH